MSDLNSFLEKAKGDEGLKSKLREAGSAADIVSIGAEAGYSFTEDDLKSHNDSKTSDLSQEDLDKVSGGTILPTVMFSITVC